MSGSDDDGGGSAIDDDDDGIDFCSRDGAAFFFRPKDKFIGPSPRPVKSCCGCAVAERVIASACADRSCCVSWSQSAQLKSNASFLSSKPRPIKACRAGPPPSPPPCMSRKTKYRLLSLTLSTAILRSPLGIGHSAKSSSAFALLPVVSSVEISLITHVPPRSTTRSLPLQISSLTSHELHE